MVTPLLLSISNSAVLGPPLEFTNTRLCPEGAVKDMAPPVLSNTAVELLGMVIVTSEARSVCVLGLVAFTVMDEAPVASQVELVPKVILGVLIRMAPPPVMVWLALLAMLIPSPTAAAARNWVVPAVPPTWS